MECCLRKKRIKQNNNLAQKEPTSQFTMNDLNEPNFNRSLYQTIIMLQRPSNTYIHSFMAL